MLAPTHAEVRRYDREDRAREILRGSRLFVVDGGRENTDLHEALTSSDIAVRRFDSLGVTLDALCRSVLADALIVDCRIEDGSVSRHLREADPTLASFIVGRAPKLADRVRSRLAGFESAPILDRPAARFEFLEFAADAVLETRRLRQPLRPSLVPVDAPARPSVNPERPRPDTWSCELLRDRICYWSAAVDLSERETEVMRGAVRRLKNKEIAAQLGLSVHAVKKYLHELLHKLGLDSRHEVAWLLDRTPQPSISVAIGD